MHAAGSGSGSVIGCLLVCSIELGDKFWFGMSSWDNQCITLIAS